ncbi:MAG TPA: ATP-dependent helicase [Candidatus Omnitrophota bacterium]|mgnify:CR=1 FL=1|nr:ATP-dependent helicase [Candidatus Omnitrophota bacterium]HQL40682.1 ATP-dependent helicase [Candidatus Omnitrophota bacterium]
MQRPIDVNATQWQAVTHTAQNLLIVAGPGTGKTHTLIYRILYAFESLSDDKRILAVTFTNKSAQEMRTRLARYLPSSAQRVDVGTFHSFCLSLLREHTRKAKLPEGFRVAGRNETVQIAKKIWRGKKVKEIEEILKSISWQKNTQEGEMSSRAVTLWEAMRQEKLLDFDDILFDAVQLLRDNGEIRAQMQAQYSCICVDEYQDINFIQHQLLKFLKGSQCALTAIGDPRQAIYGFRGSDVKFFHSFTEDFAPARTLSLSDNYRASENLLKAAGQVIERSSTVNFTPLVARIHAQGRLTVYQAASERAEAEYIVHEIEKLIGGTSFFSKDSKRVGVCEAEGFTFADTAILCRLKSQQRVIIEALERSGIPYQVCGARPLFEEPEIADMIEALCAMSEQPLEKITQYLSIRKNDSKAYARLVELAQGAADTPQFLSEIFLQREDDNYEVKAEKVSVLTMHAAKGLEFAVVFIAGCEENIIPLSQDLAGLEEERRLFYVAMTRAKTLLYLTRTAQRLRHGKIRAAQTSRFLADIEDQLKDLQQRPARKPTDKHSQLDFFGKR